MATRKNEEKPKATEMEKEESRETPEESTIEVEVEEPEEDEEEVAAAEDDDDPKPTRREKKRQRGNAFREAQERAAAAEAKAAALEAQQQQYIQQAQIAAQQQQFAQQAKTELERVYEDQKTLYAAFEAAQRAGLSDAQAQEYERKAQEIEQRKYIAIAKQNGIGQQVNAQQIAAYVEVEHLKTELSDILSNPAAKAWGEGRAYQIASERGMPQTKAQYLAIIREAAEETRQRFGLGQRQRRPAPDTATKSRFSGVPARINGAGGETVRVSIGRDQRRMAAARYPDLSEEEAVKKWANGPGKRASLAMQRKSG